MITFEEAIADLNPALIEPILIQRITDEGRFSLQDIALREETCNLYINNQKIFSFSCTPQHQDALAVGYCISTGRIKTREALADVTVTENGGRVDITLAPRQTKTPTPPATVEFTSEEIHRLQAQFNERCALFRKTGAAHSVALADKSGLFLFIEDVARHNALDKVIGRMFLDNIATTDKLFLFSGRVAEDMVVKVAASGVKMIAAPGAPTLSAIRLAEAHHITLMGFVRRNNINIYTAPERII